MHFKNFAFIFIATFSFTSQAQKLKGINDNDCTSKKLSALFNCNGKGALIKYTEDGKDDSLNKDEIELNCLESLHYGQYVGGSWTGSYHSPYYSIEIYDESKFLVGKRPRGMGEFTYDIIQDSEQILMSNDDGEVMVCEGIISRNL